VYGNLQEVQQYLGHSTIGMTEVYSHFIPRQDAARCGSEGLAAMLGGFGTQVGTELPTTGATERTEEH
jgi:hypothetical protein